MTLSLPLQRSGLPRMEAFWIATEHADNFLKDDPNTRLYGEGPDPVVEIDETRDPIERQLAEVCLLVRKNVYRSFKHKSCFASPQWETSLTKENMSGLCGFVSGAFDYLMRKTPDFYSQTTLVHHQVTKIFPEDEIGNHVFVLVYIKERRFLVDLSVRQFLYPDLRLRDDEIRFFDALLRDGFIELTDEGLSVYRRFLQAQHSYERRPDLSEAMLNFLKPQWRLSTKTLSVIDDKILQTATTTSDYTDKELQTFFNPFIKRIATRTQSFFDFKQESIPLVMDTKIGKRKKIKPSLTLQPEELRLALEAYEPVRIALHNIASAS